MNLLFTEYIHISMVVFKWKKKTNKQTTTIFGYFWSSEKKVVEIKTLFGNGKHMSDFQRSHRPKCCLEAKCFMIWIWIWILDILSWVSMTWKASAFFMLLPLQSYRIDNSYCLKKVTIHLTDDIKHSQKPLLSYSEKMISEECWPLNNFKWTI